MNLRLVSALDGTISRSGISIAQLRAEFAGQVIGPDDAEDDDARAVFLPLHDRLRAKLTGKIARTAKTTVPLTVSYPR
jgi:hypothetical protein